jgi:seryl-tRNA synthetase
MLDIRFIRENPEAVKDSIRRRGLQVDVDKLLDLDTKRRAKIAELEEIQAKRNTLASESKNSKPSAGQIELGKDLKSQHESKEKDLEKILNDYQELLYEVPNLLADNTPDGGEEDNLQIHEWGKNKFDFVPKDHLELSDIYDLYDFEAGAKVSGAKFYFTKHKGYKLWQAIQLATQEIIESEGFEMISVPHLVNKDVAAGTGYLPKGEENQNYIDQDQDLVMIATSEIPITGLYKDEVIKVEKPLMYAGISPCYRLEAGTYGKFNKGLYRTHQFEKLEMYVFCKAEDSDKLLQKILEIEKKICEAMEVPYRVVRIAAGDMSAPAYEKYDLEYYSPVDKEYRELTSCSNCTDYQARNLNIKYKDDKGQNQFAHTLNGTAVVSSRMPIAILENHQKPDGRVKLPEIIAKYYGADEL